jgi:hypothetical protein
MDAEFLAGTAGIVLSLLFSYVPGLNDWFNALEGIHKRLVMGALLVLVGAGAYGLACAGLLASIACNQDGAIVVVRAIVAALITNQSVYQITKG